jgi:NADPH:quinone reductase-like Zn-dependent oxidoreductase
MTGLTALNALELTALKKGQILAVSGGAGLLAHYAIAARKQRGIKVIADAKPADAELVRGYGADIVVERGPGFAEAIRRELPNGGFRGQVFLNSAQLYLPSCDHVAEQFEPFGTFEDRCTARARGRRPSWSAGNPVLVG